MRKLRYAVLLLLVALLAVWLLLPRQPIVFNASTAAKLRAATTEAEVEHALGYPAGDYSSGVGVMDYSMFIPAGTKPKEWKSDAGMIVVFFDKAGKTTCAWFMDVSPQRESVLDKFRRRLRL